MSRGKHCILAKSIIYASLLFTKARKNDNNTKSWNAFAFQLLSSLKRDYRYLAVETFTPGPMVEATVQDLIYWPLAAAGLAFTTA